MKFGPTGVPTVKYTLLKTGRPYFDTLRLHGLRMLAFPTSHCTILDQGVTFTLTGAATARPEDQRDVLRLTGRLGQLAISRVEELLPRFEDTDPNGVLWFFQQDWKARKSKTTKSNAYLEPSHASGSRGFDSSYSSMASQMGEVVEIPIPDFYVAVLGLCQVVQGRIGEDTYLILPKVPFEQPVVPVLPQAWHNKTPEGLLVHAFLTFGPVVYGQFRFKWMPLSGEFSSKLPKETLFALQKTLNLFASKVDARLLVEHLTSVVRGGRSPKLPHEMALHLQKADTLQRETLQQLAAALAGLNVNPARPQT